MRAHYPELQQSHINPIKALVAPLQICTYNDRDKIMAFDLGDDKQQSTIKFGHWVGEQSEDEYNGLEYDWMNWTSSINWVNFWKAKPKGRPIRSQAA